MAKVTINTLGCKANQYDSEELKKEFKKRGWEIVGDNQQPDVFLVNSCTVTNEAARQSRQMLRKKGKETKNPFLVLFGCYPQAYPEQTKKIPGVDLVLGRMDLQKAIQLIEKESGIAPLERESSTPTPFADRTRAFLKIEDGCEAFCSYCIVPRARGKIWSKPLEKIMTEVELLLEKGFKEIVLTGIHLGYYGKDLAGKVFLEDVVKKILKTPLPRLRLSSLEMNEVSDELIEIITGDNALCPHLHLPLQSGSDKILQKMNRKYTAKEYIERAEYLRRRIPDLGLTTDVMVGFPGETEKDFLETFEAIKEIGFSRVHVFSFSKRDGTPAAEMEQQVPGPEKKKRNKNLREAAEEQQTLFNSNFIGREQEVLVEGTEPTQGYSENYIKYYLVGDFQPGKLVSIRGEKLFQDGLWGKEV